MSAEAAIVPILSPLVAGKVWPNVAKDAVLPRIVYQQVGGLVINYTESTLPDKENARMQIVCWAKTCAAAIALIKQVEEVLMAAPVIQVERRGARVSGHEQETDLYSSMQDFSIWTAR